MKIKRLEISGFKSFADQVLLDFQQPVTGVVGPNGCGKSNIVDAIRWCMGEQSAKHLRGKAMEDVIFAGSETRKPLGLAEVTLTFSTEDGRAPAKYLDYAEIQLTRRLYRNGDSDYLINKTPCRLLDITELFMDTGVGTRAYSIIEQGKIGQILHSRPEERRFLIEEAAGVTKFKARKQLALKKIESTRLNLTRLADVLGEIRRQLSSLQRQAKKAEKFREFRDEVREIDLMFTARNYLDLVKQSQKTALEMFATQQRLNELETALATTDTDGEQIRLTVLEAEKGLNTAQEEIYRIKSEFNTAENRLQFRRKEQQTLTAQLERLASEATELDTRLRECEAKQENLELRKTSSSTDTTSLEEELIRQEGALAEQQQREEERARQLESGRKELFNRLSESAQLRTRHENSSKRLTQLTERILRNGREAAQLAERLAATNGRRGECELALRQKQEDQELARVEQAALRQQETELNRRLPEVEKQWQTVRDDLNRSSSRLHSLKELEAQFAGFGQGVKNLMKSKELRPLFDGVLADAIQAPAEFEAAMEAVLADKLQALVCHNQQDALQCLDFLRSSKGGRALFALPLTVTAPLPAKVEGAISLAEQVQFTGTTAGLLQALIASVVVVDSLEQGVMLATAHPGLTTVTRQGELVTAGGIITGGSGEQLQGGIIHKKREIRELEQRVTTLEQELSRFSAERETLRRQSQEVAATLKQVAAQLHQAELALTGLTKDRQQIEDDVARILDRQSVQELENDTLAEEQEQLQTEISQAASAMAAANQAAAGLEQQVNRLKSELEADRSQLAVTREKVTNVRVQVATVREQHEAHLRGIIDLQQQVRQITERRSSLAIDREKSATELETVAAAIAADNQALEALLATQLTVEQHLQQARETYELSTARQATIETGLKGLRDEIDLLRRTHSELSVSFSTVSLQAELCEQGVQERSRIPIQEAVARLEAISFDPQQREARRNELQGKLDELGEVNLMAIEEYAGMEERFNFLSSQKDDLEESLHSLQQAIQRINRTTRQRFQETFELVNAKFKEVFPRLFCGGCAELRLTNEEDLLESGIDIIVQPPGKKLQNVMLLSGGEKALTAVALIFSIFLIKPTPFCLLDEVDAPLDDANIGRFNDMVREMSAISQFIIITHNKATMQVADTLYGITMEEPGASKIVSVRLH